MNSRQYIAAGIIFIAAIIVPAFFLAATPQPKEPVIIVEEPRSRAPNPFDTVTLSAHAAYVFDVNAKKALYAHNAETQLPLASLTKVMVALVASEQAPSETFIAIKPDYFLNEGDSGFFVGERWRLNDLLNFMLMTSSNDGADAVASVVGALNVDGKKESVDQAPKQKFINTMNARAAELGLSQTYFLNETGLDKNTMTSGAYGSAHDMALIFSYALQNAPEALEATRYTTFRFTSVDGFAHTAENTNDLAPLIPAFIAGKTGFTDLAGGNLVIAFEAGPGRPIVI